MIAMGHCLVSTPRSMHMIGIVTKRIGRNGRTTIRIRF